MRASTNKITSYFLSFLFFSLNTMADSFSTEKYEAQCKSIGFSVKTEPFASCVLELFEREQSSSGGVNDESDLLCKKYGLKPQSSGFAECRMRIDFAKAESKRQQEKYEREQREYDRKLAAIEKEKERRRSAALLELGSRMMGGQSPINALGSLGTGAPIAPARPSPINQTITLPGGRMINCSTTGTITNCF